METKSNTSRKWNYRITVIFRDEIITEKFTNKNVAISTIVELRALSPEVFMSGALEERNRKWEVIWVLGNK